MIRDEVVHHQRLIISVNTVVLVLGTGSYILRLYARSKSRAKFWYDDYVMAVGLVSHKAIVLPNFWAVWSQGSHHIIRFLLPFLVSAIMLVRKSLQSKSYSNAFKEPAKMFRPSLWFWSTSARSSCWGRKTISNCMNDWATCDIGFPADLRKRLYLFLSLRGR